MTAHAVMSACNNRLFSVCHYNDSLSKAQLLAYLPLTSRADTCRCQ
jgi:hypothetical protein